MTRPPLICGKMLLTQLQRLLDNTEGFQKRHGLCFFFTGGETGFPVVDCFKQFSMEFPQDFFQDLQILGMLVFGFAFCNDFYFMFYWWPSLKTRNMCWISFFNNKQTWSAGFEVLRLSEFISQMPWCMYGLIYQHESWRMATWTRVNVGKYVNIPVTWSIWVDFTTANRGVVFHSTPISYSWCVFAHHFFGRPHQDVLKSLCFRWFRPLWIQLLLCVWISCGVTLKSWLVNLPPWKVQP